ncbi:DUF1987 domain-containing protein [Crocinitomix catalasitica]|nr:DUF1987 domain-containing protein [Crocinitomix catalasitica]
MENFLREGTDKTPYVSLQADGQFEISGCSKPEDCAKFFFKIMDWMSDYFRTPAKHTQINISFRYINSSSCSMIYKIFHFFNRLPGTGRSSVSCHWIYEEGDEQMKEFILQIKEISPSIDFTFEVVGKIQEDGALNKEAS